MYVIVCLRTGASCAKVTQITPSTSCCTPNSKGIIAKGISPFREALRSAAMPSTESAVPATKLAVAEKHIVVGLEDGRSCPYQT